MYVCPRDVALGLSRFLHQYPRAGFTPPVIIVNGVDTVSVENLDLTRFAHGYVADARELLGDVHSLFRHGAAPSDRFGLRQVTVPNGNYWEFAK